MEVKYYNVVGVMSGTSLDGVDLAQLHFSNNNGKWSYEILNAVTYPYTDIWVSDLKNAVTFTENELLILNRKYTQLLGSYIVRFINEFSISNLDAICSHGHTVLHQPQSGITLQIGNLPELATLCQQKIACDFRVQDVQLGGQGAPLVPIGDQLLFSEFDFCLNLGGFSNISFQENGKRIAFDISPVNTVLNFYANKLGFDYDDGGKIAAAGNVNETLLIQLNQLEFYQKAYPKSLGIEFVQQHVFPLLESSSISISDKISTFTNHIAFQIGEILRNKSGKLLITGGGAYNTFLIELIRNQLPQIEIAVTDKKTIEFKEALIFGFLGVLKLRGENNVLASVTGAKKDHCAGFIYLPENI